MAVMASCQRSRRVALDEPVGGRGGSGGRGPWRGWPTSSTSSSRFHLARPRSGPRREPVGRVRFRLDGGRGRPSSCGVFLERVDSRRRGARRPWRGDRLVEGRGRGGRPAVGPRGAGRGAEVVPRAPRPSCATARCPADRARSGGYTTSGPELEGWPGSLSRPPLVAVAEHGVPELGIVSAQNLGEPGSRRATSFIVDLGPLRGRPLAQVVERGRHQAGVEQGRSCRPCGGAGRNGLGPPGAACAPDGTFFRFRGRVAAGQVTWPRRSGLSDGRTSRGAFSSISSAARAMESSPAAGEA